MQLAIIIYKSNNHFARNVTLPPTTIIDNNIPNCRISFPEIQKTKDNISSLFTVDITIRFLIQRSFVFLMQSHELAQNTFVVE
jgi:hypothetical protein